MDFLDLIFPKRCVSCGKFGTFFCQNCIGKLKIANDVCPVCEKASMLGVTHSYCQTSYSLDGLTSGFYFTQPIKEVIHRLKYHPYIVGLIPIIVDLLWQNLKKRKGFYQFLEKKPTVVPVPLYWWRKHLRGYNQAELLAGQLSNKLLLPKANLLLRKKSTRPQSELSFKERKANVANIFMIDGSFKNSLPENVVLIDDVWTTGSTLKSAGMVLKRKGIKTVWALTLAR